MNAPVPPTEPDALAITIRVDDLFAGYTGPAYNEDGDREPLSVGGAIIERAARMLLERAARDEAHSLHARIREVTEEEIRSAVSPLIERALTTPEPRYGSGASVTLADRILQIAQAELHEPREHQYGKPRKSLVQTLVEKHITREVDRELQAAVLEAKEQAKTLIRQKAAAFLATEAERSAR